VAWMFVFC